MSGDQLSSDPVFLAAYGGVVRRAREQHSLDRKELAEAAGISYSYLSAIESGQKLPSITVQRALAAALGVEAAELLARANGDVEDEPVAPDGSMVLPSAFLEQRWSDDMAAEPPAVQDSSLRAARTSAKSEPAAARAFSRSGALAELEALMPTLSSEDAALIVSLARRLSGGESSRRDRSSERRRRDRGSRELRTETYLRFWTMYLSELERRGLDWGRGRSPEPRSYFTTPSPIRGASLSASFARNRLLRHELYINRGSRSANLELLRELEAHRDVIEEAYGHRLEFEDPGRERRAVRIAEYREGHISRTGEFDDYIDWFIDRGAGMRKAIDAYLADR